MSHCLFCGHNNGVVTDWPIECDGCGKILYSSPKPVVAVLLRAWGKLEEPGLIVIKRGIEPHKDTWAFPGGYIDYTEGWRAAAARETREELGIDIDPTLFRLRDAVTTPTSFLVMFVGAEVPVMDSAAWADHDLTKTLNDQGEQEILEIDVVDAWERADRSLGVPSHDRWWKGMNL